MLGVQYQVRNRKRRVIIDADHGTLFCDAHREQASRVGGEYKPGSAPGRVGKWHCAACVARAHARAAQ